MNAFDGYEVELLVIKVVRYTIVFIFGRNIFRRGARGKCLACELLNFELLYLAEASAENALPTKYMTLGPKLYLFSVLSPRICFCFVNPYFFAGCAAFFAILRLAVSKHDLKASETVCRKFACDLGFAGTVCIGPLSPEGD